MALTSISTCPICGDTEFTVHLSCIDHTATQEHFSLKKCSKCQFTFTSPRPDDSSLPRYYLSDKYISHTGSSKTLIDKIYLQARKITLGWKRNLVRKYSISNKILDVGCGTGEFLYEMKSQGWDISGIEPSANARESAEKKIRTKILESLDDVSGNNFSVITLWHVLEHLPDLNLALQTLHKLINETGTIFIAVPNLQSYDATYYQSFWAGYDVPRHLWHFDRKTMKILLEKNSLKLIKTVPMRLDSFYVSLLSESYKNPKRTKLVQLLAAFMVGLKSNLMGKKTSEYSSLIYIVKR